MDGLKHLERLRSCEEAKDCALLNAVFPTLTTHPQFHHINLCKNGMELRMGNGVSLYQVVYDSPSLIPERIFLDL